MGEKDAEGNKSQRTGSPWKPGAHDDGSTLLFIALSVLVEIPAVLDRATS